MKSLLNPVVEIARRLPHDSGAPVINGPAVFALTPGRFTHCTFPVRGARPLSFSVEGELPGGIVFDPVAGRFSGCAAAEGEFPLRVTVRNAEGEASRDFTLSVREGRLGAAPLMGWTSWSAYAWYLDQEKILASARLLKSLGLAARGYTYVNIDSCWQGNRDHEQGGMLPNRRFPDMPGMVREIHDLGLKAGIYSTPMVIAWGSTDRELFPGSTGYPLDPEAAHFHFGGCGKTSFEEKDAALWAGWGFDYLKYDWPMCDIPHTKRMREALDKTGRDMILSLTTSCKVEFVDEYRKYCQSCRGNCDTVDFWPSLVGNLRSADQWLGVTGPYTWFDLDMLALGVMEIGRDRPGMPVGRNNLTRDEAITHFSVWSILGSPLQLSCRLDKIDEFTLDLVSNEEVIALNQDITATAELIRNETIAENGTLRRDFRVYRRKLADGAAAYCFVNLADDADEVEFALDREYAVRDLWARRELGRTAKLAMVLPPHGCRVLKLA